MRDGGDEGRIRKVIVIAALIGIAMLVLFGDGLVKRIQREADRHIHSRIEDLLQ